MILIDGCVKTFIQTFIQPCSGGEERRGASMNVLFGEGRAAVYFFEIEILRSTTQHE